MKLTHARLISLIKAFGYPGSYDGHCHGYTMMWLQAVCSGREDDFSRRLALIKFHENPIHLKLAVDSAKDRLAGSAQDLLEEYSDEDKAADLDLLEVDAFLGGVKLFQDPNNYQDLFNASHQQGQITAVSKKASSLALKEQGGIDIVFRQPYVFNRKECAAYFRSLAKIFNETPNANIGFKLGSDNHAIGVRYDVVNKYWRLLDINKSASEIVVQRSSKLAKKIFSSFVDNLEGYTAFEITVLSNGHEEMNDFLVHLEAVNAAHQNNNMKYLNSRGAGLLYLACKNGHVEIIKALLEKEGIELNNTLANGITPLYIACENGHVEVVKLLLEKENIKINESLTDDTTPLYIACQNGHVEVVKALLKKEEIEANKAESEGITPLCVACEKGHVEIVKALLKKEEIEANKAEFEGVTPLYIACENGHVEVVKALLEKEGIELNNTLADGATSLYIACEKGHVEVVKALLEQEGVELNKALTDGATPLYIACENGHVEVVKALLEQEGVELNKALTDGATPLYIACENGHVEVVKALLEKEDIKINESLTDDTTPLYIACQNGHLDVVKALLKDLRTEVNKALILDEESGEEAETALYIACQYGHFDIVKALLNDSRTDVNKATDDGETPLSVALEEGHLEIVALLEKAIDNSQPNQNEMKEPRVSGNPSSLFSRRAGSAKLPAESDIEKELPLSELRT